MKTKSSHMNRHGKNPAPRHSRRNPSLRRLEPVANWQANVNCISRGPNRADFMRKVKTNGVKEIDVLDLFDDVQLYLRQGYEVRLTSANDGQAIRLYPCLDANYEKMFVAAMTMGNFRHAIEDVPFRMKHCGETVNPETESATKRRKAEALRETRRAHVTPDTVVTCPNCGTEFRVGKILG